MAKVIERIVSSDAIQTEISTFYIEIEDSIYTSLRQEIEQLEDHFENIQVVIFKRSQYDTKFAEESIKNNNHLYLKISEQLYVDEVYKFTALFEGLNEPFQIHNCSSNGKEIDLFSNIFGYSHFNHWVQSGLQLQMTSANIYEIIDQHDFEAYRIGNSKANLQSLEPICRDSAITLFNLNTLKKGDFNCKLDNNPSGYMGEEALQFLKYAGSSNQMRFINIFGMKNANKECISWLSQAAWYIGHGLDTRITDNPYEPENVQEYLIQHEYYEFPLIFLKSKKTGRWWFKIPVKDNRLAEICVSCEEEDYTISLKNDISHRILRSVHRFT